MWRLYSIARYEQRDGGTYVEVEAIALSRDIPLGLRLLVSPIVRHVSRNSIFTSLLQTKDAVRSTEDASRTAKSQTTADNRSRNDLARDAAVVKVCVQMKSPPPTVPQKLAILREKATSTAPGNAAHADAK